MNRTWGEMGWYLTTEISRFNQNINTFTWYMYLERDFKILRKHNVYDSGKQEHGPDYILGTCHPLVLLLTIMQYQFETHELSTFVVTVIVIIRKNGKVFLALHCISYF